MLATTKSKFTIPTHKANKVREAGMNRPNIYTPRDCFKLLQPRVANALQESMWVVALDCKHKVLDVIEVAKGDIADMSVHPRQVFRPAIELAASAVVLVHNHPSGDLRPSEEDKQLTWRMWGCGELTGIPVVDHLVVTKDGFTSLALEGKLVPPTRFLAGLL